MINRITKDTWDTWADNIDDIIYMDIDNRADAILEYLQGEGAFTLVDDDE